MTIAADFGLRPVRRAPARRRWREAPDVRARLADELVLKAVSLRLTMNSVQVAAAMNTYPEWVRKVTDAVQANDMCTPDTQASHDEVAAAYAFVKAKLIRKVRS